MKLKLLISSILLSVILFSCQKENPKVTYSLNVRVSPPGTGVVNPSSGVFNEGELVTILAAPNDFSGFKNWSGNIITPNFNPQIQITMDSDKNLIANFEDLDDDNDEILNSFDECPGTLAGAVIDNFGCSAYQYDPDGDGVEITFDYCPLTPPGSNVDNFGCSDIFYLDDNGITIKVGENARLNSVYELNGITYTALSRDKIREMINNGEDLSGTIPFNSESSVFTSMNSLFRKYSNQTFEVYLVGSISHWDVSKITDMHNMFVDFPGYISDLSYWDVSNVTDMSHMFQNTNYSFDLSEWDTSSVTNMSSMFSGANYQNNLNNWDVSKVTNMTDMFINSNYNEPLNNWDVSNVTSMRGMFYGADEFNQPIGNWDVSNVTTMRLMFQIASNFNQPIGGWDVSSVTDMAGMFYGTPFNRSLNNWDVSNVIFMEYMFGYTRFNLDISNWDVSNVANMSGMFSGNKSFNRDISNWNVSNVIHCGGFSLDNDGAFNKSNIPNFTNCNPD